MQKNRTKKRKTWIIPTAIAAAAAVVLVLVLPGGSTDTPQLDLLDTTVLTRRDMRDSISATGVVESARSTTVYSTMAYPVKAVHVEVGDTVKQGDLLAELDDQTIRNQITNQELSLATASQSGEHQVSTAQQNYSNFKSGLDQGLNTTLNSAQTQVDTAYDNYVRANNTYERYLESLNLGENTTLLAAETALRNAETALETAQDQHASTQDNLVQAQDALESAEEALHRSEQQLQELEWDLEAAELELADLQARQSAGETGLAEAIAAKTEEIARLNSQILEVTLHLDGVLGSGGLRTAYETALSARDQLNTAFSSTAKAVENAEAAYNTQKSTYNATVTTVDHTLADYLTARDTAWDTYQKALTTLAATRKAVDEQLASYANSVTSAEIASGTATMEESLRQLETTLADTRITAPCAGTVTAVYAEVGGAGSGLLFVIEDVDNLVVATSVKGYDMGTVKEGMRVEIRSDATGDAEIDGIVSSIAPTADKTAQGMTAAAGDATFSAEVEVQAADTGLRIGMEAQLDYIIAEETDVLAVPYDAVYENEAGQTCVLTAVEADGKYRIAELPVTAGMDDDLDMVITGSGVIEGLRVIHEPDSYRDLLGQTVAAGTGLSSGMAFMGGVHG